jgi:cellulose synthase/poly-beta-1,6-N-acetylglucosamine synthase-like glycosyltransferase
MQLPTVDIIIAARNEARHIAACLKAISTQDYPPELLAVYLVDNGSTDQTAEIARAGGARVLQQPKPGAAAARNLGIAAGGGELIGLLDAHCQPHESWVRLLAAEFSDPRVGGCQGSIDNRSVNRRVQKYLETSRALSNERVLEDTIKGERNLYPWILSGNSMYRRAAVEAAGLFNEELRACEDVDLAWRVLLLGYQLNYVAEAATIHYNNDSWHGFLKKGLRYGAGAAHVAHIYRLHGAGNKFRPASIFSASLERSLSALYYRAGYSLKNLRVNFGLDSRPPAQPLKPVLKEFRAEFQWADGSSLQISDKAIYWFRDRQSSVIVNIPEKTRIVLRSTGDFIWRRMTAGSNRARLIQELSDYYNVSAVTAGVDLDEFVEELIAAGVVHKLLDATVLEVATGCRAVVETA